MKIHLKKPNTYDIQNEDLKNKYIHDTLKKEIHDFAKMSWTIGTCICTT
jgi:hypothetical protein